MSERSRAGSKFAPTFKRAMETSGRVIVEVPADYSDNHKLFEHVRPGIMH